MKKVILLALTISLFSCSSDEATALLPLPTPTPDESSLAHFRASLNGQEFNYSQTNNLAPTHYCQPVTGYSGLDSAKSIYYASFMMPYPSPDFTPRLDVTFNNMYQTNDTSTETAAFYGLFTNIPTNFITEVDEDNWVKGISVNYVKADGTWYTTLDGDQTGSTINITSSTSGTVAGTSYKTQTISGTVSCKLYNDTNHSDVIVLTNGNFKLVFEEYN